MCTAKRYRSLGTVCTHPYGRHHPTIPPRSCRFLEPHTALHSCSPGDKLLHGKQTIEAFAQRGTEIWKRKTYNKSLCFVNTWTYFYSIQAKVKCENLTLVRPYSSSSSCNVPLVHAHVTFFRHFQPLLDGDSKEWTGRDQAFTIIIYKPHRALQDPAALQHMVHLLKHHPGLYDSCLTTYVTILWHYV